MTHAAMAPFAIMGAAQAIMHQDHPRNAQQAAALRTFATSLPEVAEFTSGKDLSSPANAERAVKVLTDLLSKAQALGATELEADPGFQSALSQASGRFGAKMGLDAVDLALNKMAENPATAAAVPELRKQLAAARRALEGGGLTTGGH
jgi:membrane-bound ClpP family serine protease